MVEELFIVLERRKAWGISSEVSGVYGEPRAFNWAHAVSISMPTKKNKWMLRHVQHLFALVYVSCVCE